MRYVLLHAVLICAASLIGCGGQSAFGGGGNKETPAVKEVEVFEGPVARAMCGPGSQPETDIQGRVPLEDRQSGRSTEGYWCNLELVGKFQGEGASWQHAWYEDCAYYTTAWLGGTAGPHPNVGVQVIDVADPANPQRAGSLVTPAMLDPWESLKVNEKRGLLGADAGWNIAGPLFFDLYDLTGDCTQPALLASVPAIQAGHEGNFAPDGMTYYVGTGKGIVDVGDPTLPKPLVTADANGSGHGLSLNEDGTRMYAVNGSGLGQNQRCATNGLTIFDTSQIQSRQPLPSIPVISSVCWEDGTTAQHTIPVFYDGKPFIIFVDEGGKGAARIIDISDEKSPFVVSKLKLEIHMPDADTAFAADCANGGIFCYEAHYCGVDRPINPTALGCGYFNSGIRVFDIRDPYKPTEIAYFNPPAQAGNEDALVGSEHAHGLLASSAATPDLTADWCSANVRLIPERGELWTTCQDNGFMVLRFTNGVWPFPENR